MKFKHSWNIYNLTDDSLNEDINIIKTLLDFPILSDNTPGNSITLILATGNDEVLFVLFLYFSGLMKCKIQKNITKCHDELSQH